MYQWLVCLIMIMGMMSGGFIIHGIAYLELAPNMYICNDGTLCEPVDFCEQKDPIFKASSISYNYTEGDEPN
jgi:hypothetical protein